MTEIYDKIIWVCITNAVGRNIVVSTDWKGRGSNPGGGRFSVPFQDDRRAHPAPSTEVPGHSLG
jgi:hypothetical protein